LSRAVDVARWWWGLLCLGLWWGTPALADEPARSGVSDPVEVHVLADPELIGGQLYYRRSNPQGEWVLMGTYLGNNSPEVFENELLVDVELRNDSFFTLQRAHYNGYEPRSVESSGAMGLEVTLERDPPQLDGVHVALVVVLPLFLAGVVFGAVLLSQKERHLRNLKDWKFIRTHFRKRTKATRVTLQAGLPRSDITRFGTYHVVSKLGKGGMATVFKVQGPDQEIWALKAPSSDICAEPKFVARFEREVAIAMQLDHPNIVRTVDAGMATDSDGVKRPYMVMEMVSGEELGSIIDKRAASGRPPDLSLANKVAESVLAGLSAAHAVGVIHRDMKPSNVMITEHGDIKIMDFGIARLSAERTLTAAGALMGTPVYMAPEQINAPSKVDHRIDL
jgi:hypothetical protein